jgi:hypothetical protein
MVDTVAVLVAFTHQPLTAVRRFDQRLLRSHRWRQHRLELGWIHGTSLSVRCSGELAAGPV